MSLHQSAHQDLKSGLCPLTILGHACPKKNRPYFSLNRQMRNTKFKKNDAILVYEHVDIIWTYQGAKIKLLLF